MTEAQLISIMAAIIYAGNKSENIINEEDEAVEKACDLYDQVVRTVGLSSTK